MVPVETLRQGLALTLGETSLSLGHKYEGKVRDNYSLDGKRYIVTTDRISALDHVLGTLPFKGQVLTALAAFWFERTKSLVPNHLLRKVDPNVLECVECEPLMVEMVVRSFLTGTTSTSIWTHYENGARTFCGHPLAEGLKKNQRLPEAIVTPATKAPKGQHDVSGSREEMIASGAVTAADFDRAATMALALFAEGQRTCLARGLILVDTKYEFGKTKDGTLVVIDEMHTPDSSRFWMADTYEERFGTGAEPDALDKDYVRKYLLGVGFTGEGTPPPLPDDVRVEAARRYIAAFERITETSFTPDLEPPQARIQRHLSLARTS